MATSSSSTIQTLASANEIIKQFDESREAITSLSKFIKFCWPVVEPGTPYIHGWHIDAICDHLEAVSRGEIRNLVINCPPRHMKSLIASVFWPIWQWLSQPHLKFLCSSYAMNLSIRDGLKCRRLIQSPLFQKFYGDKFQLKKDQNTKSRFDNNHLGYRLSISVDSMGTGEGGDIIVCLDYKTKIDMKMGALPIGYIVENRVQGLVSSYNVVKNRVEYKKILNWFESESKSLVEIIFDEKRKKSIICTPEHPVFIIGKGYMQAKHVIAGYYSRSIENKQIMIEKVNFSHEKRKMYNIEVEHNNNYYANDILVHNCDDPHSTAQANSDLERERALVWWSETMSSRGNNPKTFCKVIVMQRQHHKDLSGFVLARGGYEHLCLPAEYEAKNKSTSIGFVDPRTQDGELLWPERINRKELDDLKKELGSYAVAGQLQQRPAPRGGGIIKRNWLNFYKLLKHPNGTISQPFFNAIYHSWDTAFKEGEENDYSVCTIWGIRNDGYYLIHRWKQKVDLPELERVSIALANQFIPNLILIEDKASGQSLIQILRKRTRLPIKAIKVDRDKVSRVHAVSPLIESKLVHLPENEPWIEDYIENLTMFPNAEYDDDVDSTTQALTEMALRTKNYDTISRNQHASIIGR